MSQLAYRKHLQRQVVFGARILQQRARRFNFMRCGNRWNVRLRNVRLTSTRSIKVSTFCRAMQIQSGVTSPRGGHRMNFKRPTAASDTGQCGDCYN